MAQATGTPTANPSTMATSTHDHQTKAPVTTAAASGTIAAMVAAAA